MIKDLGEVALDGELDDGVLRELPLIGWFFGGVRVVRNLKERLFLKKLASFLTPVSRVSPDARKGFVDRMDGDPDLRQRVGDGLVLLLDRHEHFEKSEVLGVVFSAFVVGTIGYNLYQKAATVVDRASPDDLRLLAAQPEDTKLLDEKVGQALSIIGAAAPRYVVVQRQVGFRAKIDSDTQVEYELSEVGELVASLLRAI